MGPPSPPDPHLRHPVRSDCKRGGSSVARKPDRSLRHRLSIQPNATKAGRPGARRRRWSIRRKVATLLTVIVGLLGLFAAASYGYVRYQFDQVEKLPCRACVHVEGGKPYNVLVIGRTLAPATPDGPRHRSGAHPQSVDSAATRSRSCASTQVRERRRSCPSHVTPTSRRQDWRRTRV